MHVQMRKRVETTSNHQRTSKSHSVCRLVRLLKTPGENTLIWHEDKFLTSIHTNHDSNQYLPRTHGIMTQTSGSHSHTHCNVQQCAVCKASCDCLAPMSPSWEYTTQYFLQCFHACQACKRSAFDGDIAESSQAPAPDSGHTA